MSWEEVLKEEMEDYKPETLIISEILDKALPNFYNKIINTHPDMKKTLDEAANYFRTAYYKAYNEGNFSTTSEEEIITEIIMIVLDMLRKMEVDLESGSMELSLDEMLRQIPQWLVDTVIKKLHKKYQIGFMNRNVLERLIRIFIFSIFIIVQTETQEKVRKSWEGIFKRKKLPYTQESWASKQRRWERENEKLGTKMEIDRMTPSPLNLQMKNFQFEEMSRLLDQLYHMFEYFKEIYKRDFPKTNPKHIQTLDKAQLKIEELFRLAETLPSLYTKEEMEDY